MFDMHIKSNMSERILYHGTQYTILNMIFYILCFQDKRDIKAKKVQQKCAVIHTQTGNSYQHK